MNGSVVEAIAPERLALGVLAVVALVAAARLAVRHVRAPVARRSHPLRVAALLLAQPLLAMLLYFALFPPVRPGGDGTLVVATRGASARALASAPGALRFALPEAPALAGVERVPDLATALRRHPGARRLHVVGAGLEARDRDAAASHALRFDAAPLPRGLVELVAPSTPPAGASFRVTGRVNDIAGGTVELVDPAGRRIDRASLDARGDFELAAIAIAPGGATFALRVRDPRQRPVESVDLPMRIERVQPPRLLVLAGAPGPEVKFLRRWAGDAGLPIHTQISAGAGMQLGDAPLRLDAPSLARFDAVVLDERAWSALGDIQRAALAQAVRDGLGMVLRTTAALGDVERRRLRVLGFAVDSGRDSEAVRVLPPPRDQQAVRARLGPGTRDAPRAQDDPLPAVPLLTRRRLRIDAPDAVPLTVSAAGIVPATWRAEGRGRIALWTLTDSYALALAGRDDLHHALWSEGIATVARARNAGFFAIAGELREGERIVLCGVERGASVGSPDGTGTSLSIDPATGARACAAYWPQEAGWHLLRSGGRVQAFSVRAAAEAPGLHAQVLREETAKLRSDAIRGPASTPFATPRAPSVHWPAWLAFLLVAAATWWLERSRLGRRAQGDGRP